MIRLIKKSIRFIQLEVLNSEVYIPLKSNLMEVLMQSTSIIIFSTMWRGGLYLGVALMQ